MLPEVRLKGIVTFTSCVMWMLTQVLNYCKHSIGEMQVKFLRWLHPVENLCPNYYDCFKAIHTLQGAKNGRGMSTNCRNW